MIYEIVSIYDKAAEAYTKPVFVVSNGAAVRSFQDGVNDESSDFAKHPSDYALFHLGSFDDATGTFTPQSPAPLAQATALIGKE